MEKLKFIFLDLNLKLFFKFKLVDISKDQSYPQGSLKIKGCIIQK